MDRLPCEELYRSPHRLSFFGSIISFDCKRATNTGERSESMLTFCRFSFKREDNGFLKATDGAAAITGTTPSHVSIVKCQRALHVQRRVTTPCVLVMKRSERGESFRYSLLTLGTGSSDRLEPCLEFKLPYRIGESVSILRGPTVLWRHAGDVFYTSVRAGEVRRTPVQLSHGVVGELPLDDGGGEVFVVGLQGPSEPGSTSQVLGCLVDNGRVFDGTLLLPRPYMSVTRCVAVLSARRVDGGPGWLRSAVAVATSHQQLVYFEDGVVRDVCQLPFEQPEDIQVVNAGRGGRLFVISFHGGHACAVWKDTFQIAHCWSEVGSVHVDDFLGCGSDQMLLLFEDRGSTGRPLDRFLLTDLCGISYAQCQDNDAPKTSPPPPENYLLTLQALESRLQCGLSVLQELQREVRVKDSVLRQALQALTDVVSGGGATLPQPEQEGLISLWDDDNDDETKQDDEARNVPAVSSKPQVEKLWQRFAEDQMVVGVILTTESSVPVAGVSLSILTDAGQGSTPAVTQTRSQVFWLPAPCSSSSSSASVFPEPAAKRSRQHDDPNTCRLAVTAATRLAPLLSSGRVECCVMLHYVSRQDARAFVSDPTPLVLHCGEFDLDIRGDFRTRLLRNPELKKDEVKEDLLSLMAVLDHWVFHIDSPDHSLGDVRGWIQKRLGCKRIEVSPQHLLSDSSGADALMLLHWHQITPFQGELSVHSSELQTLQFLDLLVAYLPGSCIIHPVNGRRGAGAAQVFSLALEREVVSLRECASSLLCEGEEEEGEEERRRRRRSGGHEETPEPASVQQLQQWRELWQQDADRTGRRLSPLVDVGRHRRLTQSLSQVQLDVDLAALLDARRTLLS